MDEYIDFGYDIGKDLQNAYNEGYAQGKADAVKHGAWVDVPYVYIGLTRYMCDQCSDDEYWKERYINTKEKYCPNCGAKMDTEG